MEKKAANIQHHFDMQKVRFEKKKTSAKFRQKWKKEIKLPIINLLIFIKINLPIIHLTWKIPEKSEIWQS